MSSPDKSQIDIVCTISAEKKRHLKINDKYQSTISVKRYLIVYISMCNSLFLMLHDLHFIFFEGFRLFTTTFLNKRPMDHFAHLRTHFLAMNKAIIISILRGCVISKNPIYRIMLCDIFGLNFHSGSKEEGF